MAKIVNYRQCKLEKKVDNGTKHLVSYIPDEFAVVGKVLKLRDADKVWENGWVVKSAGGKVPEKEIVDAHQTIKGHRKMTGDSLPK